MSTKELENFSLNSHFLQLVKRSIQFITSSIKTISEINDCIYYHDSANTIDFHPHHFPILCSLYRPLAAGKLTINPTDSTNRSPCCHSPSFVSERSNSRPWHSFSPISHQGPLLETIHSLHGAPQTGCCQLASQDWKVTFNFLILQVVCCITLWFCPKPSPLNHRDRCHALGSSRF